MGAVLISAPSAQSAPNRARVIRAPCGSASLAGAITTANATPATLRLAADCTYNLTAALPQIGVVTLDRSIVRRNSTGNCLPLNSVPGCVG